VTVGAKTGISWTDSTWNPIRGCSRVSEGCRFCYAEVIAARFSGPGQAYEGLAKRTSSGPRWTGKIVFVESVLDQPLRWHKPRRIFANSTSDLFHEKVKDDWLLSIFSVMASAFEHTFQVLTKRPERMRDVMKQMGFLTGMNIAKFASGKHHILVHTAFWKEQLEKAIASGAVKVARSDPSITPFKDGGRVPPNVWLGVSVEDQATADERIPFLLETPAAIRFVSYEPALGPVNFEPWLRPRFTDTGEPVELGAGEVAGEWQETRRIDWIIIGAESGPSSRMFDLAWARKTIKQGKAAGIPVFMKQIGARPWWDGMGPPPEGHVYLENNVIFNGEVGWRLDCLRDRAGADPSEWPRDLRVQEFPQ
jgi:protein gp37